MYVRQLHAKYPSASIKIRFQICHENELRRTSDRPTEARLFIGKSLNESFEILILFMIIYKCKIIIIKIIQYLTASFIVVS